MCFTKTIYIQYIIISLLLFVPIVYTYLLLTVKIN
jgi:hypothetical protein